jgi:surface antigen
MLAGPDIPFSEPDLTQKTVVTLFQFVCNPCTSSGMKADQLFSCANPSLQISFMPEDCAMSFAKKAGTGLLVVSIGFSSGCTTSGNDWANKENIGTVLGGAAGVLIGSRIGAGGGRTAAMLLGGLAGSLLGKTIGAKMDESDRLALAAQTQQVLNSSKDGQATSWQSNHSGSSAQITPVSTETVSRQVAVKRLPKIQPVTDMTVLNKPYRAIKSANLRNAPDSGAEKVGGLPPSSTFTALGRTHNDWIMVGRRGVTVGYVYAPLVEAVVPKPIMVTSTAAHTPIDSATDLDNLDAASAVKQGVDLDAIDAKPVEDQLTAQTTCRTVNYDVKAKDGNAEKQTVKACQAGDGAWELI